MIGAPRSAHAPWCSIHDGGPVVVSTNFDGSTMSSCSDCKPHPKSWHGPPKPRPELLPPIGLIEAAEVMAAGEAEHGERWRTHPARHHVGAALRHTLRWLTGQRTDPDDGLSHLAHAASRLLMATENDRKDPDA